MIKLLLAAACFVIPYDRGEYKHWSDFNKDGFDTRAEILIERSLCTATFYKYRVVTGCWVDAYSGHMLYKAKEVHIDHVVALKEAHDAGAKFFTPAEKENFANDKKNLVITLGKLNMQKSAHPPHEWYPPREDRKVWNRKLRPQIMKKNGLSARVEEVEKYLE